MLTDLMLDLRAALRSLSREPGFVLLAVMTLAVGVGATITVFGMADQLLLRPVPGVADPDRAAYLVLYSDTASNFRAAPLNAPDFDELRKALSPAVEITAYGFNERHVSADGGPAQRVFVNEVYGDYFDVLGVRPVAGRLFDAGETAGDPRVAVISETLATRLFGDARSAAGRTIQVNGETVTVEGVAGGGFVGPERSAKIEMWVPASSISVFDGFPPDALMNRENRLFYRFVIRLERTSSTNVLEARIRSALAAIASRHPDSRYLASLKPVVLPSLRLPPFAERNTYSSLSLFAGAAGLVLLISCTNVATLLFMRGVIQRGSIATRRALGASRDRIARSRLAESAVMAVLGAAVGLSVAWVIALPFRGERLTRTMPSFNGFAVDERVLVFALAALIVTLLIFGLVPALTAGRFELSESLRAAGGQQTQRLAGVRRLMTTAQVAICVTLLVGAGLLLRTVRNLYDIDTGLSTVGVYTLGLGSPSKWGDPSILAERYRSAIAAVRRVPGIEDVALGMDDPLAMGTRAEVATPEQTAGRKTLAVIQPVSAEWFRLLGVKLVSGKAFSDGAWQPGLPVPVVVTTALAHHLFPYGNVIGTRLRVNLGTTVDAMVVGVTRDLRTLNAPDRPLDAFFVPLESFPAKSVTLIIRSRSRSLSPAVAQGVREALEGVLPTSVSLDLVPANRRYAELFSQQRVMSRLLELLAVLAVALVSVGLYSVVGFSVAQRRREFGIRIALGADAYRISRHVLVDAVAIVGVGTMAGLLGAYVLSIVLQNQLYGIPRLDLPSYAGAVLFFAVVAGAAFWRPIRMATKIDPLAILRDE